MLKRNNFRRYICIAWCKSQQTFINNRYCNWCSHICSGKLANYWWNICFKDEYVWNATNLIYPWILMLYLGVAYYTAEEKIYYLVFEFVCFLMTEICWFLLLLSRHPILSFQNYILDGYYNLWILNYFNRNRTFLI